MLEYWHIERGLLCDLVRSAQTKGTGSLDRPLPRALQGVLRWDWLTLSSGVQNLLRFRATLRNRKHVTRSTLLHVVSSLTECTFNENGGRFFVFFRSVCEENLDKVLNDQYIYTKTIRLVFAFVQSEPFSRFSLLICITIQSSMYVRQFRAILQF